MFGRSQQDTVDERCPKCGAKVQGRRREPIPVLRILTAISLLLVIASALGIGALVATDEGVANEFRQVPQPRPNRFHIAIDVSGTIRPDALKDIRRALLGRLRQFIGEPTVFYEVHVFGLPGCGPESLSRIVSTVSPDTVDRFIRRVEQPIDRIRITRRTEALGDDTPLTTPFYRMLETLLKGHPGERIIVISDLVNDEFKCADPARFPAEAMIDFGAHPEGQLLFLYTAPYMVGEFDTPEIRAAFINAQQGFMNRMNGLQRAGKIRVGFEQIPDTPLNRERFLNHRLKNAIPATTVEMVWARVRRLVAVIVLGIRG